MQAEILLEYDEERVARAVADAVSPDNLKTPVGLSVKTIREGRRVCTRIECKGKLPTFVATIDDLLFCASTAEKTVHAVQLLES